MLRVQMTADERNWVRHAADLRHLPIEEYVKRAINTQLRHEGVDAVLIRQSDDEGL